MNISINSASFRLTRHTDNRRYRHSSVPTKQETEANKETHYLAHFCKSLQLHFDFRKCFHFPRHSLLFGSIDCVIFDYFRVYLGPEEVLARRAQVAQNDPICDLLLLVPNRASFFNFALPSLVHRPGLYRIGAKTGNS